jgi:hypothetical protein
MKHEAASYQGSERTAGSQIVEVDPLSDSRWDAFVDAHPAATGHHMGAWASILRDCYGYLPRYIALEENSQLTGVLPLTNSGRRLTGSRLTSLPTAKAAGPLATTLEGERSLLQAAVELKRREGLGSLAVRSEHAGLQTAGIKPVDSYATYVLEIGSSEELLERLKRGSKNTHRSILKAQKSGLVVRESSSQADLRDWYRLYLAIIRKHRNLPRRLRQFQASMSLLAPWWRLITVHKDDRVIAGGVFHDTGETIELIYSASHPSYLSLRPNHALYWHTIDEAAERGRRFFDFGTANSDALRSFKEGWGAMPRDVYLYVDHHTDSRAPAPAASTTPSRKRAATVKAKHLFGDVLAGSPLLVNRALGALAYRVV